MDLQVFSSPWQGRGALWGWRRWLTRDLFGRALQLDGDLRWAGLCRFAVRYRCASKLPVFNVHAVLSS